MSGTDETVDRISSFKPWGYWTPQTGLRQFTDDDECEVCGAEVVVEFAGHRFCGWRCATSRGVPS